MDVEPKTFSSFATILDSLKLTKTAKVFRQELQNSKALDKPELTLSKNKYISNFISSLNISKPYNQIPQDNMSNMVESNWYKSLYDNLKPSSPAAGKPFDEDLNTKYKQTEPEISDANNITNQDDSMFNNWNTSTNLNNPNPSNNTFKKIPINKAFSGNNQLDKMLRVGQFKIDQANKSINNSNIMNSSSFFQNSQSMIYHDESNVNQSEVDEYVDDDDPGYDLYECDKEYCDDTSKKWSEQYGFPDRAVYKSKFRDLVRPDNRKNKDKDKDKDKDKENKSNLPPEAKHMKSNDPYYPIISNGVWWDSFDLKIIIDREKIGFEPEKEIKFTPKLLIAGRYTFIKEMGDAAFSTAIQCLDIFENKMVCIKVIKNNKDYMDQSIDEIKLLRYINANGDPDEKNFLRVYDYFYFKEHWMIVTELWKDNWYDYYKYIHDNNIEYFCLYRIQKLTKQILECLQFIHGLKIIHCDLKPENILMKSITDAECKVIDFGSSCFIHDHLSSYIQSRSYRAPEVIWGCKYDYKIDMWSWGCILVEIFTGSVLFQNDSVQSMLTRIIGISGAIPDWMFEKGKWVNDFFTKEKLLYMEPNDNNNSNNSQEHNEKSKKVHILVPKKSSWKKRWRAGDTQFFDFVRKLLEIDPNLRLNATEAINHPFIKDMKYPEPEI